MQKPHARIIRLLIVDSAEVIRIGLRLTLEEAPDFQLVGQAKDGQEAVRLAQLLKPDVILMSLDLPGLNGLDATIQLKTEIPECRILMLSDRNRNQKIFEAIAAGADGYCLKQRTGRQLIDAVRAVSTGAAWLDPSIANRVLQASSAPTSQQETLAGNQKRSLSPREFDVLKQVVEGLSNQEIASRLDLSIETVRSHISHLLEKMSVADRTQMAVKALRDELV